MLTAPPFLLETSWYWGHFPSLASLSAYFKTCENSFVAKVSF